MLQFRFFRRCVLLTACVGTTSTSVMGERIYSAHAGTRTLKSACVTGRHVKTHLVLYDVDPWDIDLDPVEGKLYWVGRSGTDGVVQRANLDGTHIEMLAAASYGTATGMAIDLIGRKVYWAHGGYRRIERANLDGSDRETVVSSIYSQSWPRSLSLDMTARKIYWADATTNAIHRVGMSGGAVETLIDDTVRPMFEPFHVAVDPPRGKLYWTDRDGVHRANLDGTQMEDVLQANADCIVIDSDHGKLYWTGSGGLQRADLDGSNGETVSPEPLDYRGLALDTAPCGNGTDCQGNGSSDDCDLCAGLGRDCNENDVPDECDVSDLHSPDCNGNDIPDECDISAAVSDDCNDNGIPDECETEPYCAGQGHACVAAHLNVANPRWNDGFGAGVSLRGDRAVIGASRRTLGSAYEAGAVYVFQRVGRQWTQEAAFTANDARRRDAFGLRVAQDGDRILASASWKDAGAEEAGAAYIFESTDTGWTQSAKLTAHDPVPGARFGIAVALAGDVAVIGAPFRDERPYDQGAAYVFRRDVNGWHEEAKLMGPSEADDYFATQVATDGVRVAVGAPGRSLRSPAAGAVYVYRHDPTGWLLEARLTGSIPSDNAHFGGSISLSGDGLLVGASCDNQYAMEAGAAYVFRRQGTTWSHETTLKPLDVEGGLLFGWAVALDGPTAMISSLRGNDDRFASPSVYLFRRIGAAWVQEAEFTSSIQAWKFGGGLSLSDDSVLVGAVHEGSGGSAYVLALDGPDCDGDGMYDVCDSDCNENDVSDACDILAGTSIDTLPSEGNEIPDECEEDCNANGIPDLDDVHNLTSPDCNRNSRPDECDLADGTSENCNNDLIPDECQEDCNANGIPDDCDIAAGTSDDCDRNAVPDECEPDCNLNRIADACDVEVGISDDCDRNGVPDECEQDCNRNGIADACDIGDGSSLDLNENDIPDECEPPNDLCEEATLAGLGMHAFDATWANTDGGTYLNECGISCQWHCMEGDIWFDVSPACSGIVHLEFAGASDWMTVIVYEGCGCPVETALRCSVWTPSPRISFSTVAGECYKIRIGNAPARGRMTVLLDPPCDVIGDGDVDRDGDLDIDDYADVPDCLTGPRRPGVIAAARCRPLDADSDLDADLHDLALLLPGLQNIAGLSLHVPGDFLTIQSAIDAAQDHDTVLVAPGIYAERINLKGKPIHVLAADSRARAASTSTIIDGVGIGPVVRFSGTESASTLLSGFTIMGGRAPRGGGIKGNGARARVHNCSVRGNLAEDEGAGIHDLDGEIRGCTITGNSVDSGAGGGLGHCDGRISGCTIAENSAGRGAGVAYGEGTIDGCRIAANKAEVNGGGLYGFNGTIAGSMITSNTAGDSGGGCMGCDGTIVNTVISGNSAVIKGGGLASSDAAVTNCTLTGNRATPQTFAGAVHDCDGGFSNCIFWGNSVPWWWGGSFPEPSYSCMQSHVHDQWGPVECDPMFVLPGYWQIDDTWTEGNYRLKPGSPCIDAGTNLAPGLAGITLDSDGMPRFYDAPATPDTGEAGDSGKPIVDMGPFEFGDCNLNGIPDLDDVAAGTSEDCNDNGIPDECVHAEADCNDNQKPDACDIADAVSADCSGNGVPDECEPDCNDNTEADSCDIWFAVSDDCNNNRVPDECEVDCNGNQAMDWCDIDRGTSQDCNNNEIPDECDIAAGVSEDCYGNGIPDECDIDCNENDVPDLCDLLSGLSQDCDGDGVPEECATLATDVQRLYASTDEAHSYFAYRMVMKEGRLFATAHNAGNTGPDPDDRHGAVYVFALHEGRWIEEAQIVPPAEGTSGAFARDLAVGDNIMVVGGKPTDTTGSIFVFERVGSEWVFQTELMPSSVVRHAGFGFDIAVGMGTIVVGAYSDDGVAYNSGAAFVFEKVDGAWIETKKFVGSDTSYGDYFGEDIAIDGNTLVIGAWGDDDKGSAYVYHHDGNEWVEEAKLAPPSSAGWSEFGRNLDVYEDTIVVGAHREDDFTGAVYIYQREAGGWVEQARLTPPSTVGESQAFGSGVSVHDRALAVAAPSINRGNRSGSVQLYANTDAGGWQLRARLTDSHPFTKKFFGFEVQLDTEALAVNVLFETENDVYSGYVSIRDPLPRDCDGDGSPDDCAPDCNGNGVADTCDVLPEGPSVDCNGDGVPDECQPDGDCNANGIGDLCDLGSGVSNDCNVNHIPDECDIADGVSEDSFPHEYGDGIPDECQQTPGEKR